MPKKRKPGKNHPWRAKGITSEDFSKSEELAYIDYGKNRQFRDLWRKFRLTGEDYFGLLDAQNGRCAICDKYKGEKLVVDHDHQTNCVRELLCTSCNTGLGLFGDDPKTLFLAMQYLRRHGKR